MKRSRKEVASKATEIPNLRFEDGRLTSFAGLVVHLLLGFRELRQADYYRDDPLVQRIVGFDVMPDGATLSKMLKGALGIVTYLLAGLFAFNLTRELHKRQRATTRNRATLWTFEKVDTVRKTLLQWAG